MYFDRYGNQVDSWADAVNTIGFWVVGIIAAFILIRMVLSFFVVTNGAKAKIVEVLGKPSEHARLPGLSFKAPWPIGRVVGTVNLQLRELKVEEEIRIKSNGSDGFVNLPVTIQFLVDAKDATGPVVAHYKMNDPEVQMKSYIGPAVRASANNTELMELFGDRDAIERKVLEVLQEKFGQFGFKIENVLVDAPRLPEAMMKSFNKVIEAEQQKRAATSEAEAAKIKLVGVAKAEKESKKLQGEGMADMRKAVANGSEESIQIMVKAGMTVDQAVDLLKDTNRLDTISGAAAHGNLILLDVGESKELASNMAAVKAATKEPKQGDRPMPHVEAAE